MNKLITLDGIHPELDLGVCYLKAGEEVGIPTIAVTTKYKGKIEKLGVIELNLPNLMKFKSFDYIYSERNEDNKWEVKSRESLILSIPREFIQNELIGGFGSAEEEIEF